MFSPLQVFLLGGKTDKKKNNNYPADLCVSILKQKNEQLGEEFSRPQGSNQWNNDAVEMWMGNHSKQSYSYLIQSNDTTSFTWMFQRTEELIPVSGHLVALGDKMFT